MHTTIKTTGARDVQRRLSRTASHAQELTARVAPSTPSIIGESLQRSIQRPQPPLKPATIRQRIADQYPPGPPLRASGALYKSLEHLRETHDENSIQVRGGTNYLAAQFSKRPQHITRDTARQVADLYRTSIYAST